MESHTPAYYVWFYRETLRQFSNERAFRIGINAVLLLLLLKKQSQIGKLEIASFSESIPATRFRVRQLTPLDREVKVIR